jgi:hypothetical protein
MYNHLHEKGEEPDLDDYDHAQGPADGTVTDENYSHLGGSHIDRAEQRMTESEYAETTDHQDLDDYFSLEKQ